MSCVQYPESKDNMSYVQYLYLQCPVTEAKLSRIRSHSNCIYINIFGKIISFIKYLILKAASCVCGSVGLSMGLSVTFFLKIF